MVNLNKEAKVGVFVLASLVLLVMMSLKLGVSLNGEESYTLYARFDTVAGLSEDSSVRVAGVEVGRIEGIVLEDGRAKLILAIKPEFAIGEDYSAMLRTQGLLGEKYLALIPGTFGAPPLNGGDEITEVVEFADLDKLVNVLNDVALDIKNVSSSLSDAIGTEDGTQSVKTIVANIESITEKLEAILSENDGRFSEAMVNIEEMSKSLNSVMAKIDDGEGTLGKLINDSEAHDNINKALEGINKYIETAESFKVYVGFRSEYLFDADDYVSDFKNYFSLKIQPQLEKYYLIEVVNNPRGYIHETIYKDPLDPSSTSTIITAEDDIMFTALVAKRFKDIVIKGGIIESTGGVALDYYLFNDRLKFGVEVFDFNAVRGTHIKAGVEIAFNDYFFMTAGMDDAASKLDLESAYIGLGFRFEDDDMKYLLASAPKP